MTISIDKSIEKEKENALTQTQKGRQSTKLQIGKSSAAKYLKRSGNQVLPSFPIISKRNLMVKVDKTMFEEMKALRDKGLLYTEIGSMMGLCRQTIKRYLKTYMHDILLLLSRTPQKEPTQKCNGNKISFKSITSSLNCL
jgi:hypothetical protein